MTTKHRRGRDPEQHVVHAGMADANRFKGSHGELTFVAEAVSADMSRQIIQMRAHNGLDAGGFVVPLVPASSPRALLPGAVVYPKVAVTLVEATPLTVQHDLGYWPLVQVVDPATGTVVADVEIVHSLVDDNSFTVESETAGDFELLIR